MAVDDFLCATLICTRPRRHTDCSRSRDTDAFVLPSKSYYPTKIPIA